MVVKLQRCKNLKNMKTSREIINEVGEWAEANFGNKKHPLFGITEELGELCHCLLKRIQGIRGFDNPEHFLSEFTDALADTGIYLAHHCYTKGIAFKFHEYTTIHESWSRATMEDLVAMALMEVARMLQDEGCNRVDNLVATLVCIGAKEGVSFEQAVRDTWAKVQKRNWKANPVDAPKHAETN